MSVIQNELINKSIRIKFSIPLISLAAGCCLIVLVFYIFLYNRELKQAMYDDINIAAMITEHEIDNLKANGRVAAIGIANNPTLISAVINNDFDAIQRLANTLVTIAQVDYCTILDSNGNVLTRTHEPGIYGDSLAHLPHVKQAFDGIISTCVAQGVTIDLGVYSGAPIFDDERNVAGIVSLGFKLSDPKFVNKLKALTMCEIGVFRNDERIATTIADTDDTYGLAKKTPEYVSGAVLKGESYTGRMNIVGQDAIVKYIPLFGADGEVVGMVGVGYYVTEDMNKILIFILSSIFITFIVITLCILLARFILRIVERHLSDMMNEVRKADETVRTVIEEKNMLANVKDIMNGLDVMIYVTEPNTNEILFMNESMKTHYRVEVEPVGKICYKILQKEQEERCSFCPCFRLDKEPDKEVVWNEHSSLTNRIYRNVDRYIKWPNGQMVHIQHSVDITELIAAKETAEMSNRSKGYFLAQMSHEIRTPMNAILGISEIQLLNRNLAYDAEEGFRKIYESGNLLLNIINDILDFSKIDAGKLEIVCERYDIPSLINDVVQLNRLRFLSKNISLIISLDENTPLELIGDELRIKQILYNLLSNAFKYTEAGEVELSVFSETERRGESAIIIFRVRDTGQGMTESQVSRIFDEYSRFNMETNRSISGTGLGMSITKRLLDMMNGEIHVESKPGEGSVFTVRMPQVRYGSDVCGAEVVKNLKEFNFRNVSLQKKSEIIHEHMPYGKVLVVDDVESNLLVAKGLLMPYGLHIETVTSGFEAIEKIENDKNYDIVFMDHMMPKMDGLKTTKILREMGYKHPIVALTANAVIGQEEMFLANGFDGFISKPVDSRELNYILIELIRNKKLNKVNEDAGSFQDADKAIGSDEIAAATVIDVKNAIAVIEEILPKINTEGADLELYTTTVHGLKSALANIGEMHLSNAAYKLEKAGNSGDAAVITADTNEFINALLALMEKIEQPKAKDKDGDGLLDISKNDLIILQDKLNAIRTACKEYIVIDAKTALADLKQKTWPYEINKMLNEISVYLIRGEFIKVEAVVDKANKILLSEKEKNELQV